MLSGLILSAAVTIAALPADDIDKKYPLGDQLRILAEDAASPAYRKLVEGMNGPDLEAEWQRVETLDNAESFLEQHGGRDKVLANPDLKRAYERRVAIREEFLERMREGFRRLGKKPSFDTGKQAEKAGTSKKQVDVAAAELSVVLPAAGAERQWPRFRGPWGQGRTDEQPLPTEWSTTKNIVWKAAIPGRGNSSPVIWNDCIFLTSSGTEGAERQLHCLSRKDGRLVWSRGVPQHEVEPQVREKNGFASSTPITDGERVIAFFGCGGILCCDFSGKQLWHHPLPGFDTTWGTASSPALYHDTLILIQDQNRAASLFIALDKRTGELLWKHERPKAMGWATPLIVHVGDHDEMLYAGGTRLAGYDPASGRELWTLSGTTVEVVPTVVVGKDLIYSASGRQGPTLGVRPGGAGDVTGTHLAWRAVRGGPHVPTPIYVDGRLYTVNDTGIATCLEAQTGEQVWQGRIRDKFSASPIASRGLMYFCSETGVTFVLRAGDKFEIVAENDLGSPILASPAGLEGKLYIRTDEALYCIGT